MGGKNIFRKSYQTKKHFTLFGKRNEKVRGRPVSTGGIAKLAFGIGKTPLHCFVVQVRKEVGKRAITSSTMYSCLIAERLCKGKM